MLLTFVFSIIVCLIDKFINWWLGLVPTINIPVWSVPSSMTDIVNALNYFLPMNTVWLCFTIMMSLTIVRITIAVLLRIKSFIPTISST